ncbi:hypothetical protein QFZ94_006990 [Paraburkholderia sp. JPY465]
MLTLFFVPALYATAFKVRHFERGVRTASPTIEYTWS